MRRRPGEIRDAIISFFGTHQREATPAEIRTAVADYLKAEIPESSVRSYLRLNTPRAVPPAIAGQVSIETVVERQRV